MLRNGVMIVIALMSGGFIGVIVTCCMVAAKKSDEDLGGMMKEEEKKRRDGDAMRKRNHVIPVRLNAREVRELNEQVERKRSEPGRVYAFVDFRSAGSCKTL